MKEFERVLQWIELNLDKKILVEKLSSVTECSPRYLGKLFRRETEHSPAEYIRKRKLTQAAFLLRQSSRSITEIAMMYGFEHIQAFTRAFTAFFGQSPRSYRNADYWNMRLYCPSALVCDIFCQVSQVRINNQVMTIERQDSLRVNFGFNFFLLAENGLLLSEGNLYKHFADFIFQNNESEAFIVYGNTVPGAGCDSVINSFLGQLNESGNKDGKLTTVCGGDYICFSFTGTPSEIMAGHSWALGHGMHKYHCLLKRGATFTYFEVTAVPGVYRCQYHIPGRFYEDVFLQT